MGPAAWAAVGRALGLALASSIFAGPHSVVALTAKEIHKAIAVHDLQLAQALLRDVAYRHADAFEMFIKTYGDELPPELRDELSRS